METVKIAVTAWMEELKIDDDESKVDCGDVASILFVLPILDLKRDAEVETSVRKAMGIQVSQGLAKVQFTPSGC